MNRNLIADGLRIILFGLVLFVLGCSNAIDISPGIPLKLAKDRARTISDVVYELSFTIPDSLKQPILGKERLRFRLSSDEQPLVLDFSPSPEHILKTRIRGKNVPARFMNGHIVIDKRWLHRGDNQIEIEFIAGEGSLNRNKDYLYTLFVPDRASSAFPCFDQPNIKARYRLQLQIPESWVALANGSITGEQTQAGHKIIKFTETRPISSYLFSFVAGKFQIARATRNGRSMQMFYRETDREKVARNLKDIFDLHEKALEFVESYTSIPFPFEKFDFALIPSFQYGGMEHPGAILYRESSLLLEPTATQAQKLARASVIAHETSHIWFGDLVTMNWFNDVWMKEVFANFMAAKIVNPAFPKINHDLRFLMAHYPAAYAVDRTAGANPIRQPLENLQEAGTLYGAIIYQKAPIVMKHLELLMGEIPFRDGLREYLQGHPYGNASWSDLIEVLDRKTEQDLRQWSHIWVEEPGRPTIETQLKLTASGRIASLALQQGDPAGKGRSWPQKLNILLAYTDSSKVIPAQMTGNRVEIPQAAGLPGPNFILPNGKGIGYGYFRLDSLSQVYLMGNLPKIGDALLRGISWLNLWEGMLESRVKAPSLFHLGIRALQYETDELNTQRLLNDLTTIFWRFLDAETRTKLAPQLEETLWDLMEKTQIRTLRASYFSTFRRVALSENGRQKLLAIWQKKMSIKGLELSERDFIAISQELAVRGMPEAREILQNQLSQIKNPDRKARFEFVLPALSGEIADRDQFFASLKKEENRQHEPWVLDGVRFLHHPLRARQSEKYILPSLNLLQEIQRTGDIFFPKRWLDATLSGHQTPEAAEIVRRFLDSHPHYPARLRGKILQSADGLFRAAKIVYGWGSK